MNAIVSPAVREILRDPAGRHQLTLMCLAGCRGPETAPGSGAQIRRAIEARREANRRRATPEE